MKDPKVVKIACGCYVVLNALPPSHYDSEHTVKLCYPHGIMPEGVRDSFRRKLLNHAREQANLLDVYSQAVIE